jgi:hypothetical protein
MILSENYRKRLYKLAGLLNEDRYANMGKRIKFSIDIMKNAIIHGQLVGLVYQSEKMPIWKSRIIFPTTMGTSPSGSLLIRGVHLEGFSESMAQKTGQRSAQDKNSWKLFKSSNIKSMFLVDEYMDHVPIPGYRMNGDEAMSSIIAYFDPKKAKLYQNSLKGLEKQPAATEAKPKIEPTRPANQIQPTPPSTTKPNSSQTKLTAKLPTGPKPLPKVPGNAPRPQVQAI